MRRVPVITVLLATILGGGASAQVPVGPEFQVNTYTTGRQASLAAAADPGGNFVIAWDSEHDGSGHGVFAQRYSSAGSKIASEFRVNVVTTGNQWMPAVAYTPDGHLRFAWQQDHTDVVVRGIGTTGVEDVAEQPASAFTTSDSGAAAITADANGGFVVAWTASPQQDVFARRFDGAGIGVATEFLVNTTTAGGQSTGRRSVASAGDGRFVVAWRSPDASFAGVFAQRFDAAGPVGSEFRVNAYTTGDQAAVAVAMSPSGEFVVAWMSPGHTGITTPTVLARRYDAAGTPTGPEMVVATHSSWVDRLDVALDPTGGFVVVWQDGGYGLHGRVVERDGTALDLGLTGPARDVAVTMTRDQGFVVTWAGPAAGPWVGPTTEVEVFGQRYRFDSIFRDDFESGGVSAWSASATDSGDLAVGSMAAMKFTSSGLQALVDDVSPLFVQDTTPNDERLYRARFWFDPNSFDPGMAENHLRTRIFIAFTEAPTRRVAAVVLRRQGSQFSVMGRARLDDNSQADTGFFPITDGPHAIEIELSAPPLRGGLFTGGSFALSVDGVEQARLTGLDNDLALTDFVRLGALSVKSGAAGTLLFDEFVSRRDSYIGP